MHAFPFSFRIILLNGMTQKLEWCFSFGMLYELSWQVIFLWNWRNLVIVWLIECKEYLLKYLCLMEHPCKLKVRSEEIGYCFNLMSFIHQTFLSNILQIPHNNCLVLLRLRFLCSGFGEFWWEFRVLSGRGKICYPASWHMSCKLISSINNSKLKGECKLETSPLDVTACIFFHWSYYLIARSYVNRKGKIKNSLLYLQKKKDCFFFLFFFWFSVYVSPLLLVW